MKPEEARYHDVANRELYARLVITLHDVASAMRAAERRPNSNDAISLPSSGYPSRLRSPSIHPRQPSERGSTTQGTSP